MRSAWILSAVALAAASAACSSTPPLTLDQFEPALLSAQCARAVRCGQETTDEACQAYAKTPPPDSFAAAIAAGHLAFDGGQARQCMDARAALPCDTTARETRVAPAACKQMFHGLIADGQACAFDEECSSSRCDQGVCPEGVCCIGMCGAAHAGAGAVGAACDRSSECVDGFCDTDHTCHALGAAAATCMRDEQCGYGLACVSPSPSLPGDCQKLPQVGEACPYQRCADVGAVCDSTSHCVAVGLPGAPCSLTQDCSPFLECDTANHQCTELPRLGMPCDTSCGGDAYCDFMAAAPTCTTLMANGTMCDDSGTCANHNCKPGPVFDSCQDYPVCP